MTVRVLDTRPVMPTSPPPDGPGWRAVPGVAPLSSTERPPLGSAPLDVDKDGRSWRIGTAEDVAWIAGHATDGLTVTAVIPPRFDAYATWARFCPVGRHLDRLRRFG
jgi:hypothetical protein